MNTQFDIEYEVVDDYIIVRVNGRESFRCDEANLCNSIKFISNDRASYASDKAWRRVLDIRQNALLYLLSHEK